MTKIEFDDATIEAAWAAWVSSTGTDCSEFYARFYAAAANKQLEAAERLPTETFEFRAAIADRDLWKARAEKAEARLERMRCEGEDLMRDIDEAKDYYNKGLRQGLFIALDAAGFRIIPVQTLRVEVGDE